MPKPKKVLATVAIAAGLLGGGVAGVIMGVPGISGAQTTTAPDSPSTTAPPDSGQPSPDRPPHDRNCPNMDGSSSGQAPAVGTSSNLAFRQHGRFIRL